MAELPGGAMPAEAAADLALGARLRAYSFDRYKTKRKDDDATPVKRNVTIAVGDVGGGTQGLRARARPSPTAC